MHSLRPLRSGRVVVLLLLLGSKRDCFAQPNGVLSNLHSAYLPFYSTKGDWDSKLTLNNSLPQPLTASVTLYGLDGSQLSLSDVTLQPSQTVVMRLSDQLKPGVENERFQEGSLQVLFNGVVRALGPQLTVFNLKDALSFDEEPAGDFKSSVLEGLWWSLPEPIVSNDENTKARVMLANTTEQNLNVLIKVEWRGGVIPAPQVSMAPHQATVLEIKELLNELGIVANGIESGGLSISHNGPPGALIAQGVILSKARQFASNLNFVDPATQSSSVLEATGLLLGHPGSGLPLTPTSFFSPVLALKNASTSPQTGTVTVQYTANGTFQTETLPAMTLAPHEVRLADFSALLESLRNVSVRSAGVKVEFSGKPGSVVGLLSSIDQVSSQALDAPLFNIDPKVYRAGNHPFHISGNSQTVAYVKNVGSGPTTVILIIRYAGGEFTPQMLKIASGETIAFDLRTLRGSGLKDVQGRTLPGNLTDGQFIWYPHRGEGLIGRAVVLDAAGGSTSSFSCSNCCSPNFDHLEWSPTSITGVPGNSQQLLMNEYDRDSCTQILLGPYDVTNQCQYSSGSTSVATVSTTGMVNFLAAGTATITMTYPFAQTTRFDGFNCVTDMMSVSDSGLAKVCDFVFATSIPAATCDGKTVNMASFTAVPDAGCTIRQTGSSLSYNITSPGLADGSATDFQFQTQLRAFYLVTHLPPPTAIITAHFTIAFLGLSGTVSHDTSAGIQCK